MISSLADFQHPFFIGIAGTGMSALAQYLQEDGKTVSGSDRFFLPGQPNETRDKLEQLGIRCFEQDGSGLGPGTDLVVASTAIEETVGEIRLARERGIPVLRRSELLALITASRPTMAVAGTSGKSTTTAMLFEILDRAGLSPGIISGAGLTRLIRQGRIGNAARGQGKWLVIEADESDGSIVQYHPAAGLLLNVDKDHQELDELMRLFTTFRDHSTQFVTNQSHPLAASLSTGSGHDFSTDENEAGFRAGDYRQDGFASSFSINGVSFSLQTPGRHNMENAVAAVAMASLAGVSLDVAAGALRHYEGIYRRFQVYGQKHGVWLVDDYAHNPVKCAAAIRAAQAGTDKLVAWFQPHGYAPTRFLRAEFVKEISEALRPQDEIWMSEIFYAGGTAVKDISAADLVEDIRRQGRQSFFVGRREDLLEAMRPHLSTGSVLLLMGARDPSLESFAQSCWEQL